MPAELLADGKQKKTWESNLCLSRHQALAAIQSE